MACTFVFRLPEILTPLDFFEGDSSPLTFAAPRFLGVALIVGGDAMSSVGSAFCREILERKPDRRVADTYNVGRRHIGACRRDVMWERCGGEEVRCGRGAVWKKCGLEEMQFVEKVVSGHGVKEGPGNKTSLLPPPVLP